MRGVELPKSVKKYIRRRKQEIRKSHGANSLQEKKFLEWVATQKKGKEELVRQGRALDSGR